MKKTLSLVLALALALSMFAGFALVPTSSSLPDPLIINGIMVTNASGYASPYTAVDEAGSFVENQTAYVVVSFTVADSDDDDYAAYDPTDDFKLEITSSTLDLSYADDTGKFVTNINNVIATNTIGSANSSYYSVDSGEVDIRGERGTLFGVGFHSYSYTTHYYYTFIAVTKAATAGEVKAAMKVSDTSFSNSTPSSLTCYSDGTAMYTIVKLGASGYSYSVYSGSTISSGTYLFTYVQDGSKFLGIGNPGLLTWTYDGKLIDTVDGTLGNLDDKDYTSIVSTVNTYFGFSFAYNNAATDSDFENKASGNPVVVSDTYNYVTATVVTEDEDVDIVATGDFSANVVVVMASSAILAAVALAFVAKKARD